MDLDGDGHDDILSGSWPGELFWFRGGPGRTFAAPQMLKDENGAYIAIGGGVEIRDDEVLVTGNADFEKDADGKYVIRYHGEIVAIPDGKHGAITGTASAVHAADWDGDGDLDLVVGYIGGDVYVIPNEGTRKQHAFGEAVRLRAGGEQIDAPGGDAGPYVVDWDGDRDLDLLVGAGDGSVLLYRNVGRRSAPELAAGEVLIPKSEVDYGNAPTTPTRGIRAKVCAADWNGDGRLDLLVGDASYQKIDDSQYSEAERAEHARVRAEIAELNQTYFEVSRKLGAAKDEAARAELGKQREALQTKLAELRGSVPREVETRGWVWLFLQTGDAARAGPPK